MYDAVGDESVALRGQSLVAFNNEEGFNDDTDNQPIDMDHIYDIKNVAADREYQENRTSDISIGHVFFEHRPSQGSEPDETIKVIEMT